MTRIPEKLYALMALVAASVAPLSFAAPVMAEDGGGNVQAIMRVLDSANAEARADINELQQLKVTIPIGTDWYYSAALREHVLAKEALESGNEDFAKSHAMNAMELYKIVSDLLGDVEGLKGPAAASGAHDENLAILEQRADYLETLANANNVSVSFSDYHSAIHVGKAALVKKELKMAEEQLVLAESILDNIQNDIQRSADSKKEEKAKEFAQDMIIYLSEIVTEQEERNVKDSRDLLIQQLASAIQQLKVATDFDEIIEITEDSSKLQTLLRDYEVLIYDPETAENEKDEEQLDDSGDNASGREPDEDEVEDVAGTLAKVADELEDRAKALMDESNNAVATLKIQEALALISSARVSIDEESYDTARATLSAAEIALDKAEEMIQG